MDNEPERPSQRENMLAVSLVVLVGGIILFYLYLITLGIVVNVLAGAGLFILLGVFHYFLWGRSLTEEVAAERAAMLRQEAQEEKTKVPPGAIQDIARTQGIQKK